MLCSHLAVALAETRVCRVSRSQEPSGEVAENTAAQRASQAWKGVGRKCNRAWCGAIFPTAVALSRVRLTGLKAPRELGKHQFGCFWEGVLDEMSS